MRYLYLIALAAALATPSVAKDRSVKFLATGAVAPQYVEGKSVLKLGGQSIDAVMAINTEIASDNKVGLVLMVLNKSAAAVNLDETTVLATGDKGKPLHNYTRAELQKAALATDKRRRLWRGLVQGQAGGAAGGIATTQSTGSYAEPGQLPAQISLESTTTYHDPAALRAAIAENRARLDAEKAADIDATNAGMVPVTIAPGADGMTFLTIDAPSNGKMTVSVLAAGERLEFNFTVQ